MISWKINQLSAVHVHLFFQKYATRMIEARLLKDDTDS